MPPSKLNPVKKPDTRVITPIREVLLHWSQTKREHCIAAPRCSCSECWVAWRRLVVPLANGHRGSPLPNSPQFHSETPDAWGRYHKLDANTLAVVAGGYRYRQRLSWCFFSRNMPSFLRVRLTVLALTVIWVSSCKREANCWSVASLSASINCCRTWWWDSFSCGLRPPT